MKKKIGVMLFLVTILFIGNIYSKSVKKINLPEQNVENLTTLFRQLDYSDTGDSYVLKKAIHSINNIIDFSTISRFALSKYWKSLTVKQRNEFSDLLRRVVTKIGYPKVADYYGDIKIKILDSDKKKNGIVVVPLKVTEEDAEVVIKYKLKMIRHQWRVMDVIVDDISLVRNYRSQFSQIIKKNSYKYLVNLLKKKLKA